MEIVNAHVMQLKNFTAKTGRGFRHRGTGGQYIKGKWVDVPVEHVLQSCPVGFACFNASCASDHFLTQRKNLWIADSAGRFMSVVFIPGAPYGVHCTLQRNCTRLWTPGQPHECCTTPVDDQGSGSGEYEYWLKLAQAARSAAAELREKSAKFAGLADDKDAEAAAAEAAAAEAAQVAAEAEATRGVSLMQPVPDQPPEGGNDTNVNHHDDTK